MKKIEIMEIVDNYFKNIEKSFHQVLIHFNTGDIHQFRIEIKRLRAFFHLLDMETGGSNQLKVTAKMKTFYGYTGIIANLNLLLQTINSHFEYSTDKHLGSFISKLEKDIGYWKKNTNEYVVGHKNFEIEEEKLLVILPKRLRRRSIKKFVAYLAYEIQTFLFRFDDEKLNSIRKLLEDILYNWEYLKPYADILPEGMRNEDELRYHIYTLMDFRDKCAINSILDKYYNDSESDDEKTVLANLIQFCKNQKDNLKKVICTKLELIPVQPIVKRAFSF